MIKSEEQAANFIKICMVIDEAQIGHGGIESRFISPH